MDFTGYLTGPINETVEADNVERMAIGRPREMVTRSIQRTLEFCVLASTRDLIFEEIMEGSSALMNTHSVTHRGTTFNIRISRMDMIASEGPYTEFRISAIVVDVRDASLLPRMFRIPLPETAFDPGAMVDLQGFDHRAMATPVKPAAERGVQPRRRAIEL